MYKFLQYVIQKNVHLLKILWKIQFLFLFYKRLFLMRRRSLLIKICQQVKLEISIAASLIKSDVSVRVSHSNETMHRVSCTAYCSVWSPSLMSLAHLSHTKSIEDDLTQTLMQILAKTELHVVVSFQIPYFDIEFSIDHTEKNPWQTAPWMPEQLSPTSLFFLT